MTSSALRALAAVAAAAACACATYRARPLDLASHRASWEARTPVGGRFEPLQAPEGDSRPATDGAFDLRNGLSLGEGEATAMMYNASLRVARMRAAETSAAARHAGRWEDPVFGFEGERIVSGVADPWVLGASLAMTLPFSGRLDAEKREACAAERAAIAGVIADEWALRMRVRAVWLKWSFEALRTETTRRLLESLGGILATASRLEQAGELSRIEARLLRAEEASRKIELAAGESRVRDLELELRSLLGLVPTAPVRFVPVTDLGPRPPVDVTRNPRMLALRAAYAVAEESLRREIRKQYPDLTIAPGAKTDEGDERVTLGLDLPLPLWNRNQKAIAEARARRETARVEYETAYEGLVANVASADLALETAAAERAEIESTLVPMLDEQARDVQRVVDLGQVNTLVMLDTLVRQHDASWKRIDARLREALATIELQELGGPVRWHTENDR
jgi:outer membrane protein TolC